MVDAAEEKLRWAFKLYDKVTLQNRFMFFFARLVERDHKTD